MGDYAYGYVPYGGELISYILPCSDVQLSEKTAERNRAYPVTEILKENYKEDFHSAVSEFVTHKQEVFAGMEGFKADTDAEDLRFENRATRVLRVESVLNQPTHATVVDVIVRSEIRSYKEGLDPKGNQMRTYTGKRQFVVFRLRYMLDMRLCKQICLGPVVGLFRILEKDVLQKEGSLKLSEHQCLLPHHR